MHKVSSTVVVVGGIVVVVVVISVVVVATTVVAESSWGASASSTPDDCVTSDTREVSVPYCDADCTPQPLTTTSKARACNFANFTLLTLVAHDSRKSEAH